MQKTKTYISAITIKKPINILFIFASPEVDKFITKALSSNDYILYKTDETKDVLNIISDNNIDLILMDVIHDADDGVTILDILRSRPLTKDIPVVVVSNFGRPLVIKEEYKKGAIDYINTSKITSVNFCKRIVSDLQKYRITFFIKNKVFSLVVALSPTFVLKHRMRFFAILASENLKKSGIRNERVEELIYYCHIWASKVLNRNPEDKEALKYIDFPNNVI